MKKGLGAGILLSIVSLIGLASAQTVFDSIFSTIDPNFFALALLFVIFFALIYFSTSKFFKNNQSIAAVIAIATSLLAIYGINQVTDVGSLITGLGIPVDNMYTIGSIFMFAFIIFLVIKIRSKTFLVLGGICIVAAIIPGLVYEQTTLAVIGVIFLVVGLFFAFKKKRSSQGIGPTGKSNFSVEFSGPRKNWVGMKEATARRAAEEQQIRERLRRDEDAANARRSARQRDIINIESKAQADAANAKRQAEMDAERARQEEAKRRAEEAQAARKEQQIKQQEAGLISTDLNSLFRSYNALDQTYTKLYNENPSNPQLVNMRNDMIRIRDEIMRVKRSQRS